MDIGPVLADDETSYSICFSLVEVAFFPFIYIYAGHLAFVTET